MTIPARKRDSIGIAAGSRESGRASHQARRLRGRQIPIRLDREDREIERC
jgi:hypothetical protein